MHQRPRDPMIAGAPLWPPKQNPGRAPAATEACRREDT
jgi:hypothetical protein